MSLKLYPNMHGRKAEILRIIARNPYITQPQIAQQLKVKLSYIHVMMRELRNLGLIRAKTELQVRVMDLDGTIIKPIKGGESDEI